MKIITLAFCMLIFLPAIATEKADEDMNRVITMMLVAKATGMCGVFSQMISFQDATNWHHRLFDARVSERSSF